MTPGLSDTARSGVTVRSVSPSEFAAHALDLIGIYVTAMRYPPGSAQQRLPLWEDHARRPGFACQVAFDPDHGPVAFAYGYTGSHTQWWNSEVRRGLSPEAAQRWLADYAELTELHVRPDFQGFGIGQQTLQRFLADRTESAVLLSTPEGDNRAWRLYRRLGFVDVRRHHVFTGDPRPFGILGLRLPPPRPPSQTSEQPR